jgi:16S rRNA (guanine527-N7)-methyltransferase
MGLLLPPVAEYGNRAWLGPMRKPADTDATREDRNATSGSIFVSGPVRAHGSPPSTHVVSGRQAREALEAELASLPDIAARLSVAMLDRIEAYVALLLAANDRLNLTRVTEPIAIARLHLLDALVALPLLDDLPSTLAIDLGSGGGVPAIPLAIARPDLSWLLVDSVGKKARALAGFGDSLGLSSVEVIADRAEVVGRNPRYRERAGLVTARAVASLPALAELALPLLIEGGRLIAWKGPLAAGDEELRRGARAATQLGGGTPDVIPMDPPRLGGHTLVRVTKERPTPARYPRRPGEPARRPLG